MPSNAFRGSCLVLVLLLCYLTLVPALFSLGKDDSYGIFLAGKANDPSVSCLGGGCAGANPGISHGVSISSSKHGSGNPQPARVGDDVTIDVRRRSSRSAIHNIAASSVRSIGTISASLRGSLSARNLPSNARSSSKEMHSNHSKAKIVPPTASIGQGDNDDAQVEIPHSSTNQQLTLKNQNSSPFYTYQNISISTSHSSSHYGQQAQPPTLPSAGGPLFKLIHTFLSPPDPGHDSANLSREKEIQGSCLGLIIGVIFGVLCF